MADRGRPALMALGVRERVAGEYRRLVLAGVDRATAVILARHTTRGRARSDPPQGA